MNTKMKVILMLILCLSLVVSGVSASESYLEKHTELIFEQNTCFTEEQQQIIAATLLGDESDSAAETFGLKCTLFGHTYTTDIVRLIHHKVNATNPRCEQLTYEAKICEDCSDTQYTLLSEVYIQCCE